ncbi:MAG: hypothetical protein ABIO74_04630 [Dokdonella sp.]
MRISICAALLTSLVLASMDPAFARQGTPPYSFSHPAKRALDIPTDSVRPIDPLQRRAEIRARSRTIGPHSKRLQLADHNRVSITPESSGAWQTLPDGSRLWRMRVRASGATDLRLGFSSFRLPPGATLYVIGADHYYQGPYSASDAVDAYFTTPVTPGDTATIELRVPAAALLSAGSVEISSVGAGFRDVFGRASPYLGEPGGSGACNVDVVCPLGQAYPDEVRAVGYYEFQADDDQDYYACSGTLVADVPRDRRNWFLTAAHCISSATEAASMVVYWNYQSTTCGVLQAPDAGFFNDDQHGAILRARRSDVDFSLVELAQYPEAAWNVYYAGWDASGAPPVGTIGIHHPYADVKKITAGPSPATTGNCIADVATIATHWQTGPYTQGTTEIGSSGSGLFSASDAIHARLLIGTLSGGDAACSALAPSQPDSGNDCYGKFAVAWNGPDAASRLRDWLDPADTGALLQSGIDSQAGSALPHLYHSPHAIPAILLRRLQR